MTDSLGLKFDKLGKSANQNTEEKKESPSDEVLLYESESNVRNLYLILKDGKKRFLNYSYLITGDYIPEENIITLIFTTHVVTLKGYVLEGLFEALTNHIPKIIKEDDERYVSANDKSKCIVTEIHVRKNE